MDIIRPGVASVDHYSGLNLYDITRFQTRNKAKMSLYSMSLIPKVLRELYPEKTHVPKIRLLDSVIATHSVIFTALGTTLEAADSISLICSIA